MDAARIELGLNEVLHGDEINRFDSIYKKGPSLFFCQEVITRRKKYVDIKAYLNEEENIKYLYAALLAWDMNSRGAKMLDFIDFKGNIIDNIEKFVIMESIGDNIKEIDFDNVKSALGSIYDTLRVMKTKSKIVSNSKILHFLFPKILIPIDKTNTLKYLYKNNYESKKRYLEIIKYSFYFAKKDINWNGILNNQEWNYSIPKIIDNSIILCKK